MLIAEKGVVLIMTNCVVNHIVWGRGMVQSRSEKYIKVLFDDPSVGEKTFVYPDAFSKYIKYEDKECQVKIDGELHKISKAAEEQAAKAEKERKAAVASVREKESSTLSKKKKAIAYSRKRAEKLRVRLDEKSEEINEDHDDSITDSYNDEDKEE